MDKISRKKVMSAGYIILRCDDQPAPRIKYIDQHVHDWRTFEKFETKASRDRAFNKLIETGQLFISD